LYIGALPRDGVSENLKRLPDVPKIRYDPICDRSDRAVIRIIERQNSAGHAKVLRVMDIDKDIVQSVARIDKDQTKLSAFVSELGQCAIC